MIHPLFKKMFDEQFPEKKRTKPVLRRCTSCEEIFKMSDMVTDEEGRLLCLGCDCYLESEAQAMADHDEQAYQERHR